MAGRNRRATHPRDVGAAEEEGAEEEDQAKHSATTHGEPNDEEIDAWSTGPLARPLTRSLAPLTRSLAPHYSLRSHAPLRSLVRSLTHFARSLARGEVNY